MTCITLLANPIVVAEVANFTRKNDTRSGLFFSRHLIAFFGNVAFLLMSSKSVDCITWWRWLQWKIRSVLPFFLFFGFHSCWHAVSMNGRNAGEKVSNLWYLYHLYFQLGVKKLHFLYPLLLQLEKQNSFIVRPCIIILAVVCCFCELSLLIWRNQLSRIVSYITHSMIWEGFTWLRFLHTIELRCDVMRCKDVYWEITNGK